MMKLCNKSKANHLIPKINKFSSRLNNKRRGVSSLTSICLKDLAPENPLKPENNHKDSIDERDELKQIKHYNDPCQVSSHQSPSICTSVKMFNDCYLKILKDRNNKEQKKVEGN